MDDADRAERLEQQQRDLAINAIKQGEREAPETNESGQRICLDCEAVINPLRLKAKPDAVRCIGCQEALEAHRRHYA